ncbi:MAG: PleD family two-component system response regulator [Stellaceae bacterium]
MSARVLVVDDVEINVKLLEAKLTSEYFHVVTASDGMTALLQARRERPDIVLLDIMMPLMDGFEVCQRLKADPATSDIPVVMITALSDSANRVRGLEVGADDFLTKPVSDIALFARVRSLVRLKRMTDEWRLREETYGRLAALADGEAKTPEDTRPARIIVFEDRPLSAQRILDTLSIHSVAHATRSSDAQTAAATGADLLVLALSEQEDTLRLVAELRATEATRSVPILLIGEQEELARLAKGLDLGATDYLVRPIDRNELVARVRTQIRRKRLQERLRETYQRSLSMALTDSLTGLYNRRYLTAHLEGLMARTAAGAEGPALLAMDIDRFKNINDSYGHPGGDAVLCELSQRIARNVRPFDLVARYGGEEFVVVMPETPMAVAEAVAERLRHAIADDLFVSSELPAGVPVTISIGVAATLRGGDDSSAALLKRADDALYTAKRTGRNRVMSSPDSTEVPAELATPLKAMG